MSVGSSSLTESLYLPPLRAYQRTVLTSEATDDVTISAPQLGKTTTGQIWLLVAAWLNGADPRPWWWTAPTYAQARHGFRGLCDLARSAGVLRSATTSPPLQAMLTNDARLEARSWERPEGMYGPSVLGVVVDEFGQLTDYAYSAISSRRAETITLGYGKARYLGNVGEVGGPAERLWNLAEAGARGFRSRRWTWRDRAEAHVCPCGIDPELGTGSTHAPACPRGLYVRFIERERGRMSSPQFRTLYDAEWADWNELPVYLFDREKHVLEDVATPAGHVDLACDFNVDPMVWIIGGHNAREAWASDEIVIPGGATTEQAAREFVRRFPNPVTFVTVYGDASGSSRKTSASHTDYQILREILREAYGERVKVTVPSANPAVSDRVNAYNGLLQTADGTVRYSIHPRCQTLIRDLARVSWRPGTRDIDKADKSLTHASDADGYRLSHLFPVGGAGEVRTFRRGPRMEDPILMGRT